MEFVIIAVLILGVAAYTLNKKKKDDRRGDVDPVPVEVSKPTIPDLPTGNWCLVDECSRPLVGVVKHESNGGPDMICSLAIAISKIGTKPAFVGVSCSEDGASKAATVEILKALRLNIPVYEGSQDYDAGDSELAQAIIAESKKGKFTIILGSPAGDLEWAFKNGAHVHNITLHGLLRDTWNAEGNEGMPHYKRDAMKRSAHYVGGRLTGRIFEIKAPDYYHLLFKKNLPASFKDTSAFINRNRDLKAWDLANSPNILARNRALNNNSRGTDTANLRIADCLAMASYCGIPWHDSGAIMSAIQHGLDIMKDRIARGAVNTITYTSPPESSEPERPARTRDDFDLNNVSVPIGTATNPLKFAETAKITSISVGESSYSIKHTKQAVWGLSAAYQAGRYIQGNTCFIYVREDGKTEVKGVEHNVSNARKVPEIPRPKGWRDVSHIKKGDTFGVFDCTQVRSGDWAAKGQRPERTDIRWLVAK